MVIINLLLFAIWECFDGILLKPCLLQPCFHGRVWLSARLPVSSSLAPAQGSYSWALSKRPRPKDQNNNVDSRRFPDSVIKTGVWSVRSSAFNLDSPNYPCSLNPAWGFLQPLFLPSSGNLGTHVEAYPGGDTSSKLAPERSWQGSS